MSVSKISWDPTPNPLQQRASNDCNFTETQKDFWNYEENYLSTEVILPIRGLFHNSSLGHYWAVESKRFDSLDLLSININIVHASPHFPSTFTCRSPFTLPSLLPPTHFFGQSLKIRDCIWNCNRKVLLCFTNQANTRIWLFCVYWSEHLS